MSKTPSARAKTTGAAAARPRTGKRTSGAGTAPAPAGRVPAELAQAARAAHEKKATDVVVLDLRKVQAFTDFFFICTGQNVRHVQAVADAVEMTLAKDGLEPAHVEGYDRANWILLDYFTFVVHIFAPDARRFYDIERLWGSADLLEMPDPAA